MTSVGIAVIFLYDKEGKFLMQKRGDNEKFFAGYWGCFGGHMEEGESPEQALSRELIEELEYKVSNPELLVISKFIDGDREVTTYNFIERYDESQAVVQHEGESYGWFRIEEALQLKISDLRREALLKAQEFLNNR